MGIGMVYTEKRSPAELAKKGLIIEAIAFALNICRYTVPYLIGYAVTGDHEKFMGMILYRTFCCDMLEFSGLAILLVALFRRFNLDSEIMFLAACVMSFAANFFNGFDAGSPVLNVVLGHIIGTEDAAGKVFSDFPILNWFIVPAAGYVFGLYLIRVKDKKRFYTLLSPAACVIAVIYFATGIASERGMFGEGQNCYYHITTADAAAAMMAAIGLFGVYYALEKYIPKPLHDLIYTMSKGVTVIYCVQWVLVVYTTNVILYSVRGTQLLPVGAALALSLAISLVSVAAAKLWQNRGGAASQ